MGVIQIQTMFVLAFPVAYAKRKRLTGCKDDLSFFFLNIRFNDTVFSLRTGVFCYAVKMH